MTLPSQDEPLLIASDHAGFNLKMKLIELVQPITWIDLGTKNNASVDYPDFAAILCAKIASQPAARGVLVCGSGIGMAIAANKFPGIRAAVAENVISARTAAEHNHANVLCLGARILAPEYAAEIVKAWLTTPYSKDPRHMKRVQKIAQSEK